jgi:hypothetical protein
MKPAGSRNLPTADFGDHKRDIGIPYVGEVEHFYMLNMHTVAAVIEGK